MSVLDNIVNELLDEMSESDKEFIINCKTEGELIGTLHKSYGMYIRNRYKFWGNKKLIREIVGTEGCHHPDSTSSKIIITIWNRLREKND